MSRQRCDRFWLVSNRFCDLPLSGSLSSVPDYSESVSLAVTVTGAGPFDPAAQAIRRSHETEFGSVPAAAVQNASRCPAVVPQHAQRRVAGELLTGRTAKGWVIEITS